MLNVEIKVLVYIEGVPAFMILPNGEKDWIVPDGAVMYMNNKEFVDKIVDEWLKTKKIY
jgi:hypothetical protein